MNEVTFAINGNRLAASVAVPVVDIEYEAQTIPMEPGAYAEENNGNVILHNITATEENGNVVLSGGIICAEQDGNVDITSSGGERRIIDKAGVAVDIGAAKVTAVCTKDDVFVRIDPQIIREITCDVYDGAYEVTPGEVAIVLQTSGKSMSRNVTIAPVPSTYGRISWNGSFLTVY